MCTTRFHPFIGKTIWYDGLAWLEGGREFIYTGWLDIEELDSSERGSWINCWVTGYEQEESCPDRGWVTIDTLPEVVVIQDQLLPNVEQVCNNLFEERNELEYVFWDRIAPKLGIAY